MQQRRALPACRNCGAGPSCSWTAKKNEALMARGQLHGVKATGQVVVRKRLRRAEVLTFFAELEPCLVGMEACATAHHWARELIKLGHTVKLMPPA